LYALENKLDKIITDGNLGELDGHDIEINLGEASLYMYGNSAENLFKAIKTTLENSPFMKGARAKLRFGTIEENAKEIEVDLI